MAAIPTRVESPLCALLDALLDIGVPRDVIDLLAAGVRQQVRDVQAIQAMKTRLGPRVPGRVLTRPKGGA